MRAVLPHASVMRNVFPPNTKWRCVSLSIAVCSSCVAVRLGPKDATDIVSTIFRGADWILTSRYKVTKFQVSSTAVSLAPTHSSHASSSLSFYLRGVQSVDVKEGKLTVVGEIDAFIIVKKLKKICYTEIITVGPAKEPEKKPEPKPDPKPLQVICHYVPTCSPPYYHNFNGCDGENPHGW
ncbi:hypothetical protein YC2023_022377 [Brassica napus]